MVVIRSSTSSVGLAIKKGRHGMVESHEDEQYEANAPQSPDKLVSKYSTLNINTTPKPLRYGRQRRKRYHIKQIHYEDP